jgi:hypothetical protein
MTMITRAKWQALSPKSMNPLASKVGGVIIHHTARSNEGLTHWEGCWKRWQAHQKYHMNTRGWSDIAYNHLVCKHGFWFEGRGWNARNGANRPVNDQTYSICWEGTIGDRVDHAVIKTINTIIDEGISRGWANKVRGHKDVREPAGSTSCPGELYALIQNGTLIGGATPPLIPQPSDPPPPPATGATPIMGAPIASLEKAMTWAKNFPVLSCVIPIYYALAPDLGVRPDVAVAQAAKETNWGRFTGVVPRSHNNWCGLKTRSGGGNSDPNAHAQFPNDVVGVRAHLEHLHLYAVGQVLNPVDPRHFNSVAGKAPTVEKLGGKWAPSSTYGQSIVNKFLTPLVA